MLGKRMRKEPKESEEERPHKRKHVSSFSKAVLARKILSKIETENNPMENVIMKR